MHLLRIDTGNRAAERAARVAFGSVRSNYQVVAVASKSHLHLLEFIDRKALPAELRQLRSAAKAEIGVGQTAHMTRHFARSYGVRPGALAVNQISAGGASIS